MSEGRPEHGAALAMTMRRLWGLETEHRLGRKPTLTLEAIVQAAYEIADAEGLSAVSMSRVAGALECTPMALYRHVANKNELLILLTDRVAADIAAPPDGQGWRRALEHWTTAQIEAALAHPWMLDLPLTVTPLGPHRARLMDQAFGALNALDVPMHDKFRIIDLLVQHVLGEARVQVEARRAAAQGSPAVELVPHYIADTGDFPHLAAAFAAASSPAEEGVEEDPDFGIRVILDGIEAVAKATGSIRNQNRRRAKR